jgi:hypothetical protein
MTEMNRDKPYAYPHLVRRCGHFTQPITSALQTTLMEGSLGNMLGKARSSDPDAGSCIDSL